LPFGLFGIVGNVLFDDKRFPPTLAIRIPADLHQPTGNISLDE